ncbi:SdrD B-like domain-containing protein [Micromonospora auratinigra]|uniref:CARDB protein n=1 Tax=Micromonospora auratinigra TaxID=261654 RepID=A0A1A9A306_9ACTN|nr:SdrD B-like domain-containing protein [Micromonospora auratinigra]SBT50510.1 CARDB protein [Micromonospora auratinigra]
MRPNFVSRTLAALALVGGTVALPADAVAAGRTQPDLLVDSMTTDVLNPAEGETFAAQIDVRNWGNGDSGPVTVTVSIPAGLRTDTPYAGSGWNCTVTGATSYSCAYPQLLAGQRTRLTVPFVVAGATPGTTVPITATIAPDRRESNTGNNTGSVTVAISGTCVVRGTVWQDLDRDGQRDADEPAAGPDTVLQVILNARQGQAVGGGYATVAADGTWSVTARTELLYDVRIEVTGQYGRTVADVGDDATDSDLVTVYQTSPTVLLGSAEFIAHDGGEYVVDGGLVTQG